MEGSAARAPRQTSRTALDEKDITLGPLPLPLTTSVSVVVLVVVAPPINMLYCIFRSRFAGGNLGPSAPSPSKGCGSVAAGTALDALPSGLVLLLVFVIIDTTLFTGSTLLNA
jgi:hypothetical protein